ncbi:MAG TPA: hypothetical protein VMT51_00820 [Dongiaceae bacterium]|nr:hypothetical protein [Dongiaceae bacterium]
MRVRNGWKQVLVTGLAAALVAGPASAMPTSGNDLGRTRKVAVRLVREKEIERERVESLQRWVAGGHADWCKDARLVAAEEFWRLAPEFSGDGFELSLAASQAHAGGQRMTFEWASPDGRATYRVTVERFAWLLPIAKDAEAIVWVPTRTELRTQE